VHIGRLMRSTSLGLFVLYGVVSSCVATPPETETPPAPTSPPSSVGATSAPLYFPPPRARRAHRALPPELSDTAQEEPLAIQEPQRDAQGHFEFAGQRIVLRFNRPIDAKLRPKLPPLTITPTTPGTLRWAGTHGVVFTADAPFDPETKYAIELGAFSADAETTSPAWSATFRADPRISLADKVISYIPNPGTPRLVAARPYDGSILDPRRDIELLWDQPVDVATIAPLVRAQVGDESIDLQLRHPARNLFDGIEVDRKHVVLARPRSSLAPETAVTFEARDHGRSWDDATRSTLHVPPELSFTGPDCAAVYERCSFTPDPAILTLQGTSFQLLFSNTLDVSDATLRRLVRITPEVPNFAPSIDRWSGDGRLRIHGAFAPSATYEVRLAAGLRDAYGQRLEAPVRFTLQTQPELATATMPEGVAFLDAAASRAFTIQSRNVEHLLIRAWPVEEDAVSWAEANLRLARRELPPTPPELLIPVDIAAQRDTMVSTTLDLLAHLQAGRSYVVSLGIVRVAFEAPLPSHPESSWAARPPMALLTANDETALAVHARVSGREAFVHVASFADGQPVQGAALFLDGEALADLRTDAQGTALLDLGPEPHRRGVLRVQQGNRFAQLGLTTRTQTQSDLVPELAGGELPPSPLLRAMVWSDRGVYRPGATIHLKASVRQPLGENLLPAPWLPVRISVLAPDGNEIGSRFALANDMGSATADFDVPATAPLGRYRAHVTSVLGGELLAEAALQVAEFEPPRFKVDVSARALGHTLHADVEGRYLFGAAMDDADVAWTLRREAAPFPSGPFVERGLHFRPAPEDASPWLQTGTAKLDDQGRLALEQALVVGAELGPQTFTLEAEVTDASHRAIAGREAVTVHPVDRYAGVRVLESWPPIGNRLALELGVIDPEGRSLAGHTLEATLVRLDWTRVRQPGPGGSAHVTWKPVTTVVERCSTISAQTVATCDLTPRAAGQHEVRVAVDGIPGGTARLYAWGHDAAAPPEPEVGHRLELMADAASHRPGETATIRFHNRFEHATAIYTIERGTEITRRTATITAGPQSFDVDLGAADSPQIHATVTLLPRAASTEWSFGAVRLPVEAPGTRLEVAVASDRPHYEPGQHAKIRVTVAHAGAPVENAEIALAVVDEGVLRLTNFHAPDPLAALRPRQPLQFRIADSRMSLAESLARSHAPGDGEGAGDASVVASRKNFVQTALWRPNLRTDAQGLAEVGLDLPDNLTTFRMMAVVLDRQGRGARTERGFEVRKPIMGVPAVPRFATKGDAFEAAIMVHNAEDTPATVTVRLADKHETLTVAPAGRSRVAFPWRASKAGTEPFTFTVEDETGRVRDRVEAPVQILAPGIEEHPQLVGSFSGKQEIALQLPAGIQPATAGDDALVLTVGKHLRPDLGAQLEFLVDYPHGCVEQTTSGLLPLLAARDLLPRLGFLRYSREEIDDRIRAGLQRLASMKTPGGGLAYWPQGTEPDVYGTAYAMRAIALAHRVGIPMPHGLLEEAAGYLQAALLNEVGEDRYHAMLLASVALALGEAQQLPESSSTALFDTAAHQDAFGLANLALALSSLPAQEDRIRELLARMVERLEAPSATSYDAYGSAERDDAQALLALTRLDPKSAAIARLEQGLLQQPLYTTTQGTAFRMLALRERLVAQAPDPEEVRVELGGIPLAPDPSSADLQGFGTRYRIPLAGVTGTTTRIDLVSSDEEPITFSLQARWKRDLDDLGSQSATAGEHGPELYRMYTTPEGAAVDLSAVRPGELLRVALLARMPPTPPRAPSHLALVDRIPAGFEPLELELWTVSRPAELTDAHPLYSLLQWGSSPASHMELRDDRVLVYFDQFYGEYVAASYLLRATTPGEFLAAPASAELMYQPQSQSYSAPVHVSVKP